MSNINYIYVYILTIKHAKYVFMIVSGGSRVKKKKKKESKSILIAGQSEAWFLSSEKIRIFSKIPNFGLSCYQKYRGVPHGAADPLSPRGDF